MKNGNGYEIGDDRLNGVNGGLLLTDDDGNDRPLGWNWGDGWGDEGYWG